ncbi:phage tail tape measure protein [Paratissierella segnis]|uniref:Phage tail tape measure protein n=1 Tax=Paratissierella segnis TaxID=2763679 RepID=A0A926EXH0_9FIRM|nr:hypothetical protein [Paratissierella segnis]MBC8588099.1 hypothetical protein [Paratissierella segnis]
MAKNNFIVRGGLDVSNISKGLKDTEKQFKGFEGRINKAFSGIAGGMGLNLGKLSKFALIGMAAKELYKFGKASIEVASDLVEVQNVVDVTFGSMSQEVNDFASNSIKQFGLSELAAKKYSSTMGAMLKSSGIRGNAVTEMSIDLAKLSTDMASFYNLSNDVAFEKIMSGMSGMTQPLKELGINMNIANLENYAMAQGIRKSWQEMNQAEQTMLRYNYLLSVTGDAQGDFARNSGSWANQVKILKEQWQEFMSLIGKALIEILLPIVKIINKVLEGLINVTKEIGKIYTMITGKEVAVETNNNIGDAAIDAAEGEEELADGIKKAGKAAKGAIASFDEINQLQDSMGNSGGALGNALGAIAGEFNTSMSTVQVDNGLEESKSKWEKFFIWFGDKWNRLGQTMSVPLMVPAPIFATIPSPIYRPNWGLTPPLIPKPLFQPIPNPVYNPNWNLELPPIPQVVFKPIEYTAYDFSLENIKTKTSEGLIWLQAKYGEFSTQLNLGLSSAWNSIETNYNTHKENMGVIAAGISTVLVANINQGLSKLGINTNLTITTTQNNWQTWGRNLGGIAIETAKAFSANIASGFKTTASNTIAFANNQLENLKSWGSSVLEIAAETSKGFVENMVSGFATVWNNFKSLMSAIGEKISGTFKANKEVIVTTAIIGGVVLAGAGLALAAPAAIPYVASALGGLAAIPALAKGGITNGPMLAMIGDNPGGKEVVSPLDDLKGMIVEAVGTAILGTSQFNSNSNGGDIILQVDGTTFARIINPYNAKENERIGNNVVIQTT